MSEGMMLWGPAISINPMHLTKEQLKIIDDLIESKKLGPDDIALQDENKTLIMFWSADPNTLTREDWKRPIMINQPDHFVLFDNNENIHSKNKKLFASSKKPFTMFLDKYEKDDADEAYKDAIKRINKTIDGDITKMLTILTDRSKCFIGEFLVYILM